MGYGEWLSGDRLCSKALKTVTPEKPARAPRVLATEGEVPIRRVATILTFKVAGEAEALKCDALVNETRDKLRANRKGATKGYIKMYRQVCKSEWAYEVGAVFDNLDNYKAYSDSEWQKENIAPILDELKGNA